MSYIGLSISYDRVLGISTEAGNKICNHNEREKAVCPPELKNGRLFTTAVVDNIDYIPVLLQHMIHFMELGSLCFNI